MLTTSEYLALLAEFAAWFALGGVVGLCSFAATQFIRRLPLVKGWALTGRSPWGCDVCMSCWCSLAWLVYLVELVPGPWHRLPGATALVVLSLAVACSIALLEWSATLRPSGPPPL